MGDPITKPILAAAVEDAIKSTEGLPTEEKVARAKAIVLTKPTIAKATKPISRVKSQVIQGISAAGLAQIVQTTGLGESLVIVARWAGFAPDPAEFSTVLTTLVTIAGLALAWYGRETTTRPLA